MSARELTPPHSFVEPVTEVIHGQEIVDPYRWLEDQNSPQTRAWIDLQTRYARGYLRKIPRRNLIRERVREFLEVETYDSVEKVGRCYFFRKRRATDEQPSVYMRVGADGSDELLIDPAALGRGKYTAIRPIRVSANAELLLFEIKHGGERSGRFGLFDVVSRRTLPDALPRGYLRGFAFAPDAKSFYYVHESWDAKKPSPQAAYHHVLGAPFHEDREVYRAGDGEQLRLTLVSDSERLGFLVHRYLETTLTDFLLKRFDSEATPEVVVANVRSRFGPRLIPGKILALTDRDAPNLRIVEVRVQGEKQTEWVDLVGEKTDAIHSWRVVGDRVFVSYVGQTARISVFDVAGAKVGERSIANDETIRLIGDSSQSDELLIEAESTTRPIGIFRYSVTSPVRELWARRIVPFESAKYAQARVQYPSLDGTQIPMLLVGRREFLESGAHPTVMTSYGGYGVPVTPQFSVFVAVLLERGCVFALPSIRGGSEFGVEWHNAAKRHKRQTACDDFLAAAEWLLSARRCAPGKLAIFGGSNSGLLVGAAMTQRPEIFRAVLCVAPILDMIRYHRFDDSYVWREEYGTADDPDDFAVLKKYSPYQNVRQGTAYPATMIVSGDADQNCNALHARKMTARLQAANLSPHPIVLDYNKLRGHSPVLPLSVRIEALADRVAFLCDQLDL
jgi:prolyl oligopeptidase